jgi:hypothetical protein
VGLFGFFFYGTYNHKESVMGTYVPSWLFTGVHADITEWDGSIHTVKCTLQHDRDESLFQDSIKIEYCDGDAHVISLQYFLDTLYARIHHFGWTHFYSGGGSKYYNLPLHHVKGCSCKLKAEMEEAKKELDKAIDQFGTFGLGDQHLRVYHARFEEAKRKYEEHSRD